MNLSVQLASLQDILPWRDLYRHELNCQIVHDSLHPRKDWTLSYLLFADGAPAGYGSVVVGGPWQGRPTVFEFYLLPAHRARVFDFFEVLLAAGGAVQIEAQSNDPLLTVMLHTFARAVVSESILFHDRLTTAHRPPDGTVRRATADDVHRIFPHHAEPVGDWVIEVAGAVGATGGILFHYNRPDGDIYMEVAEPFRRRGLGSYLVQELKRICYEGGSVPAARCSPDNIASRKTLQRAGFVPCGHILTGSVPR